jgi:AcrR family transcriptional regulator
VRGATTRATLLAAARDLFVRDGVDATSVADVARSGNAAIGSVYHHFGDKAGLRLAVAGILADDLLDDYLIPPLEGPGSPADRLLAECSRYMAYVEERPGEFDLLASTPFATAGGEEAARVLARAGAHLGRLTALVAEGQRDGSVRDGDPGTLVLLTWSAMYGLCHLQRRFADPIAETTGQSTPRRLAAQVVREAFVLPA